MLAIGSKNPYLQTVGVKKQQQTQKNTNRPSISTNTPKTSGASGQSANHSINILNLMAMNNVAQNTSLPSDIRQPAFETLSASVNKSLNKEQSNTASLSSKLSDSKSKLSQVNQLLSSNSLDEGETEIYQLIASALQAEVKSFEELLTKSKYATASLSSLANFGVNQVVSKSDKSSDLLDMLSSSNSEYSAEASAKLLHMSAESAKATKKLGRLVQSNQVSLKKTAQKAKKENPENTAKGLDNLYRNTNLSKEDRLTVTNVLTNIATENPLNGAGKAAASGLENIFKKDTGSVARNAAVGLRFAAIAGNNDATQGLINVAKSPTAGKNKNMEAIIQLTKVAKSGSTQSQNATDAITEMANNSNFSGKIKEQLVDSLGQIAYNGGNNGKKALNSLAHIASDDKSPHQKQAFNNITKVKSGQALGSEEVAKAFANIAESKRTDTKLKKQATHKLGEMASFGNQAANFKAQDSLTKVATDPMNKASGEAKNQLQKQGVNNISRQNMDKMNIFFNNDTKNNGIAHFKAKNSSNPFLEDNGNFKKFSAVQAVGF